MNKKIKLKPKTQHPATKTGQSISQAFVFHLFSNKQSLVLYNLWKYQTHLELLRILETSANYWPAGIGELLLFKHLLKYVTSGKCEQFKMHSDPAIWAATGAVRSISPQQWEFKPCTAHPGPSLLSCHHAGLVPVPLKCHPHQREGGRKIRNNFLDPCRSRCCSCSVGVIGAGEFLLLCLQKKGKIPQSGHPISWIHSLLMAAVPQSPGMSLPHPQLPWALLKLHQVLQTGHSRA